MSNTILTIGLTGGIGSGKSTVADFFEKLNVPIIDADKISHALTQPDTDITKKIIKHFGNSDRKQLRDIIFSNPIEKKWLENLLHPEIRKIMKEKIANVKSPYCICVIPLLAESTSIDFIDRILVIESSPELQIARAKMRDNSTADCIKAILASQASDLLRRKIADDIIINKGDLKALKKQVLEFHQRYLLIKKK